MLGGFRIVLIPAGSARLASAVDSDNSLSVPVLRILLLSILSLSLFTPLVAENTSRPNVLFIAVDDLRPWIGYYGASWMKTPNMDRLAATSRVFNRHYVQVATCGASRHTLLTGLRPRKSGDYGNGPFKSNKDDLAARETESFPHLFKQNGYRTHAIGKVSHSNVSSAIELPRSWSGVTTLQRRWGTRHNFVNAYAQVERPASVPEPRNKGYAFESVPLGDKAYPDGWIAEHAVNALNELKDETFLLAVGFMKPHLPFNAPSKYWDQYDPSQIPPISFEEFSEDIEQGMSTNSSFELLGQYDVPEGGLEDDAYTRKLRHGYCAAVSYVDAQVGKVLDELDRLNLSQNTIVILWSDHGFHLGELDSWGKHTAFEHAMRSPLMVRVPGMNSPGAMTQSLTETVDIYPTLVELCELELTEPVGGTSFVEILINPDAEGDAEAFSYNRPWKYSENPYSSGPWAKTMRTDRYRFTRWTTEIEGGEVVQEELYDHWVDPGEQRNIASKNPRLLKLLSERLGNDGG